MMRVAMLFVAAWVVALAPSSSASPSWVVDEESTAELAKRVEVLEQRVRELEAVIEDLRGQVSKSGPTSGQKFGGASKPSGTKALPSGSIVITVTGFAAAGANQGALAEAAKMEAELGADDREIKRLEEQKRKLYDAFKQLEENWSRNREMSDVAYKRLMDENKNQRDDIVKVISKIEKKQSVNRRKAASLKHDAAAAGQRIEGTDSNGDLVVVTTKYDCAKVLSAGARVVLVNPKSVTAGSGSAEYTADKVESASP